MTPMNSDEWEFNKYDLIDKIHDEMLPGMSPSDLYSLLSDRGIVGEYAQGEARYRGWEFSIEHTDNGNSVSTMVKALNEAAKEALRA